MYPKDLFGEILYQGFPPMESSRPSGKIKEIFRVFGE